MKSFFWKFMICLVPIVVGAIVVGRGLYYYPGGGFKLGVDLAGGTILVYEVDPDKMPADFNKSGGIDQLAERLKRRIDPADLLNVTVRGVAGTRVEVILPFGGSGRGRDSTRRMWKESRN